MLETLLIGLILIQFQFQEDLHQKSKSHKTLLCNFPRRKFRILLQLLLPDLKAQRVIRKSNRKATKPVRRVRGREPLFLFNYRTFSFFFELIRLFSSKKIPAGNFLIQLQCCSLSQSSQSPWRASESATLYDISSLCFLIFVFLEFIFDSIKLFT